MDDGPRQMSFDEVIATLRDWTGSGVTVFVGPNVQIDEGPGMVWSKMTGVISPSQEGAAWSSAETDGAVREAVAFQIGDDEGSYFVLYRQHFEYAEWISREPRFLLVGMRGAEIGVSADQGQ